MNVRRLTLAEFTATPFDKAGLQTSNGVDAAQATASDAACRDAENISQKLDAALAALHIQMDGAVETVENDAVTLLCEIFQACASSLADENMRRTVVEIFEAQVSMKRPHIEFTASRETLDALQRAGAFSGGGEHEIVVDEGMSDGDLRARWAGGGVDCDTAKVIDAVNALLRGATNNRQAAGGAQ
ncbi:MAG: hypothetical protein KDA46_10880 [Parvularculaceae bacterium]|nr:hypothetical protein [Parvularculaceae bacterium]